MTLWNILNIVVAILTWEVAELLFEENAPRMGWLMIFLSALNAAVYAARL